MRGADARRPCAKVKIVVYFDYSLRSLIQAAFAMTEIDDFALLRATRIPTGAYRVEETPRELAKIVIAALDRIIDGETETESRSNL
jgi:hypothetical protein